MCAYAYILIYILYAYIYQDEHNGMKSIRCTGNRNLQGRKKKQTIINIGSRDACFIEKKKKRKEAIKTYFSLETNECYFIRISIQ